MARRLLLALSLLALAACGVKNPPEPADTGATLAKAPTYWRDVKPILDQHCMGCHVAGGIAPFSLEQPAVAMSKAALIAQQVQSRLMPPWPPGADCNSYLNDKSLSQQQVDTLAAWSAAGAPEGQRRDYHALSTAQTDFHAVMGRAPDQVVSVSTPYTSTTSDTDDYHCFVFDPQLSEDKFVVAANVLPGNSRIVHHVILFSVDPDQLDRLQQLDDAEPGPGYTCFGDARVDSAWVNSWAPGRVGDVFPEGTGVRLKAGGKLVMQVHYNLLNGRGLSDASQVELYYADAAKAPTLKEAVVLPVPQPVFDIPKDAKSYSVSYSYTLKPEDEGSTIWEVGGHMHLLGNSWRMWLSRQGSSRDEACMLDLPHWDFHWQGMYHLQQPVVGHAGDVLNMRCTYDNSPEHQPIINGVRQDSRDVTWGEKTTDEMCLGLIYVTK